MKPRVDGRLPDQVRSVRITGNYLKHPEGSFLIEMGDTKVICAASVEEKVPQWMKSQNVPGGWITAEYGMLPGSTHTRTPRESNRTSGRTMEIQRLIGRSIRSVVDLSLLGERTIWLDCDVIQADGGTRTAAITGAFAALSQALNKLAAKGLVSSSPIKDSVAAISVGMVKGDILLDLNYQEDSKADVDLNLVMTGSGQFVEIQATGERKIFSHQDLKRFLDLGEKGIRELIEIQKKALTG